jgi:polyisoprenyl-teichoic acid--peptidoglycan teichoic acid transferase
MSADERPPDSSPPATWAGRQRSEEDHAGEQELPPEPEDPGNQEADESEEPPEEFEFSDSELDEGDLDLDPDELELDEEKLELEDDELEFAPDGDDDGKAPESDAEDAGDADPVPAGNGAGAPETIEADTLALADSEEAKEAALAGLRARTKEQAAKRRAGTGTVVAPEAATVAPAPASQPAPAQPVPTETDEDSEPARRGVWPRFVAASFLIVVAMATATAVSLLVYLTDIAKGLGGLNVRGLAAVESGKPQNFLILGSDKRAGETDRGRSDTTILLRINPDEDVITMMSIPRDLKVNIPGVGVRKFNEAYTDGGPQLTLKTVQQLTQNRIPVNHVVNVDFLGFADAVNAIGCVYIDVDRHYYIPPNSGIAEIDIQSGYQRLCGLKALQYVRYRHTDTDLVRSARQQDFLREARAAVPPSKLLNDSNDLIDIFTKYTTSDIKSAPVLVDLLKLMLAARHAPVQEIQFPTTSLGDSTSGYVTSNNELIQRAVSQFLEPAATPSSSSSSGNGNGSTKNPKPGGQKPTPPPAPPPLIDSTASGQQYSELLQNTKKENGTPMLDFPIFYPTRLTPGSAIDDESRAFVIDGPGDEIYHGYKFVVTAPGAPGSGFPTAYYGVSGTDWKDPPILANPSEEREIDGRNYMLFYDGERLRLVGFKTDKGSYWVVNSLTQQLGAAQMLAIAQNLREYTG